MRATKIQIHNFRSIHDIGVDLQSLSIVAGANNAGKSNVVDAIRLFYGDLKWDTKRDKPVVAASDDESWVEIEFMPTTDELSQLKDDYKSSRGTFRIRNYVSPSKGTDGKARAGYYAYENGILSENLFYGAKNVGSGKVGHVVYIPAVSKLDESTKLTGPSALRELVATVLNKIIAGSPAYEQLAKSFGKFEGSIKSEKAPDGQSLKALEADVSSELSGWDASFSLSIDSLQPDDILKTLIRPQLVDQTHGGEIDQSRFGAGFQRHLIFTLIKMAAKHANPAKAPATGKKEFSPQMTWILFEEPEAFLHPTQEEVLHDSLLRLVQDADTQVLLTTHSSRFVSRSMNDLTRLVRLRRDAGITTAHQLSQAQLDSLLDDALVSDEAIWPVGLADADRDQGALMAAFKTELWMQATRTAAFFSSRVILVEGPSETAVYSYLTTRERLDLPARGLTLVDCMGKYNIHRFMALLGAFGVDHSVLYDGDDGGSNDAAVTAAIATATSAFTMRVTRLDKDLETALGVMPLKRHESHRKPQYLLYHLEKGLIDEALLEKFVAEIELLAS